VVTAAVSPAATSAVVGMTVSSIAAAATASFSDAYGGSNALFAPNAVGTQTITVQVGSGINQVNISVDINNSTTVGQFIDSFNTATNASDRAVASLVKVGENQYRVVISTLKTGLNEGQINFVVPSAGAGFGGNSDLQTRTISQATNALFSIDGIAGTITRQSNTVSDVLSGVTFQLSRTGSATVVIGNDADTTADDFQEIVDAFNDLVKFIRENSTSTVDQKSKDKKIIYGSLGRTRLDDGFLARFREAISSSNSGAEGVVRSFADMGLSTNRDGTLRLDVDKFKQAISSDSNGATSVIRSFADQTAGVEGFIYQYTTFQGLIDISKTSNLAKITNLNEKIDQLDRSAQKTRDRLVLQFTRLESVTAQLQQKQAELSNLLASLQRG
jgi:flagellar hook-associated protein 2